MYPWLMTADSNNNLFAYGQVQTVLHNGHWQNWYGTRINNYEGVRPYKNGKNLYYGFYYENNDNSKPRTALLRFSTATDMDTLFKLVGEWYLGPFTQYNGKYITSLVQNGAGCVKNYNSVVEFNEDSALIHPIGRSNWNGVNNGAYSPLAYKNKLYVTGQFDSSLAVLNTNGWQVVQPGFNGSWLSVGPMLTYNNRMYIYGGFWKWDSPSNPGNGIVAWDGVNWDSLGGGTKNVYVQPNGGVQNAVVCGGKLFICGKFTHVGGLPCTRIASWNDTTWCSVAGDIDSLSGDINSLACLQDTLYAGGDFSNVNGNNLHTNIAKLKYINHVDSCGRQVYTYIPVQSFDFKYFPNIFKDVLTIQFLANKLNYTSLDIINNLGQVVFKMNSLETKNEIDLSFLVSGIYYVTLKGNMQPKTFKVIKE